MSTTGETFYSPIGGTALSQLKAREKLVSADHKTADQLQYLNANTGYIKVTSGVNTIVKEGYYSTPENHMRVLGNEDFLSGQNLQGPNYDGPAQGPFNARYYPAETSPWLAQQLVLFNGSAIAKGNDTLMREGINYEKGSRLTSSDKAYNNYNSLGIRPMPGVTAFDIQSYNTYGTLRIANVQFVVHTLEDLDLVEKLFLRPGYSVVVEWGHSIYVDNDGNVQKATMGTTTLPNGTLFGNKTIKHVENVIQNRRYRSNYNYDAFFGYVTNFNYTFRPDGGFDCSMKIASKGVVLDSIKSGATTDGLKISQKNDDVEDQQLSYMKSTYHAFLSLVNSGYKSIQDNNFSPNTITDFNTAKAKFEEVQKISVQLRNLVKQTAFNKFHAVYATITKTSNAWYQSDNSYETVYVPLRYLLTVFNQTGTLISVGGGGEQRVVEFETLNSNEYNWFDKLFSTKPGEVLIPNSPNYPGIDHPFTFASTDPRIGNVHKSISSYSEKSKRKEVKNNILDIHISTSFIENRLEEFVKDAKSEVSFVDFLKEVLDGINSALGGITNLDIYYNEQDCVYEIVDRNGPAATGIPKINLSGLKSTVKSLNINSTLTSNIAAQIAIAAQGRDTTYPTNVRNIRGWNEGFVDRFMPTKIKPSDDGRTESITIQQYFNDNADTTKKVKSYWKNLNEKGSIKSKTQNEIENELRNILLVAYDEYLRTSNKPSPVPIPVNLDFTIKGFSGFKIGQSFKIQDSLLLPKYKRYSYIVTGLEHKVENNEWVSNIKAQFFDLE